VEAVAFIVGLLSLVAYDEKPNVERPAHAIHDFGSAALARASSMSTDVLSDVLRAVRLSGAILFDVAAASPWVAEAPPAAQLGPALLPRAQHLMEFHLLVSGDCWGGLRGEPPVHLRAGDVIVFPRGDGHVLSNPAGLRTDGPPPMGALPRLPLPVRYGGRGEPSEHLVCGFFGCEARPFNPLLAALPAVLHLPAAATGDWLREFVQLAAAEAAGRRSGRQAVLARMSELLFVEAVRRYVAALPDDARGWLGALRDPAIGRALALLHARPAHPWTLESLAREAALSRSVLAARFADRVGMPPMQYLARWRMQLAAVDLAAGGKVAAVAAHVGYESEAAFSRAFKKLVGTPPAEWRDRRERH
jgi:AraC-like DNA-binding protein